MDIKYYQNIAREEILLNEERNEEYQKIDDMINGEFELPESLRQLEWIRNRKFVSNAPRNAAMSAIRAFATLMPSIQIDPATPEQEEWERAERLETALDWHFRQANIGRAQPPHWKIIESAVKYCNVSMQTEYYPFVKKGQSGKRMKHIKRRGDFNFIVHHPSNVHARFSDDVLECVVLAQERTVADVVYQWGKENKGVKQLLDDLGSDKEEKGADIITTTVFYYDYSDWEKRVIWCVMAEGGSIADNAVLDPYILLNEEHKLPFLPWVVKDNKEPLLKNVYDTWENANIIKTIIFSKHVALAGHPSYWVRVLSSNDDVDIDNSDPNNKLLLTAGQDAGAMQPPPLDPQLMKTEADLDSQIYQSSAASVLGSVESLVGSNTPFSSINAVLQAALAQLGLAKMTAEQAETEGLHQVLRWIDYSGEPMVAYRGVNKNVNGADFRRGEQISVMPGDPDGDDENAVYFDPDEIYLNVKLNANTITDEQGRVTAAINKVERLGFSTRSAFEEIGGMNFEQEQEQKAAELLFQAEIEIEIEKKRQQLALEMQQAQMAMQMQQQMEQQQMAMQAQNQQMNSAGQFDAVQGMDTRGGGAAPQQFAPEMTREQINQADAGGMGLA